VYDRANEFDERAQQCRMVLAEHGQD